MNSRLLPLAIAFGALTFAYEQELHAAQHSWCIRFGTSFLDAGVGEDYGIGSWLAARGVRVRVTPPGSPTQTFWADSGGCFTFSHLATTGFTATIYAEARIGGTSNITIRAFENYDALTSWYDIPLDNNLEQWTFISLNPACNQGNCNLTLTTSPTTDPIGLMMATATHAVHQIDSATSPRLTGTRQLYLVNEECFTCASDDCSCQSEDSPWNGDLLYIQPGGSGQRRKFLMGHELGHWLHRQWLSDSIIQGYDAEDIYEIEDVTVSACDSLPFHIPGGHALRSQEHEAGSFIEGFAHFLSVLAMNSHAQTDAWFKYYKDTSTPDYTYDLVDVEASGGAPSGGVLNYIRSTSGCDCENSNYACDGTGVEMDWMRHYWDFRTNANTVSQPQPTHWDVFDHVRDTWLDNLNTGYGLTDTHDRLEANISATFLNRWDSNADFNGADPTPD